MILHPAHVQPASARVYNGNCRFTFHRISEPVCGGLPTFVYESRGRLPARKKPPKNDAGYDKGSRTFYWSQSKPDPA